MRFQSKKRKTISLKETFLNGDNVSPISLDSAVLGFGKQRYKAYFKKLNYKYCPNSISTRCFVLPSDAIEMSRQDFALKMYHLFKSFDSTSVTEISKFSSLCDFVRFMDSHNLPPTFTYENIMLYQDYLYDLYLKGSASMGTICTKFSAIRVIVNQLGDAHLVRKLPKIKKSGATVKKTPPLTDQDLTKIAKKLLNAYKKYSPHIINGTKPEFCFLLDDDDLAGLNEGQKNKLIGAFKQNINVKERSWKNRVTSIAYMITSMWTGANLGALSSLTRDDVIFRKGEGDNYEFNSIKARALYAKQKLGFGFTKATKEFIENWLVLSHKICSDDDSPLFPFLGYDGKLNARSSYYTNPQSCLNKSLTRINYPKINTMVFRNTRSSILMRAYNDIFVVASANNHSTSTAAKHYLNGDPVSHDITLAAATQARKLMSEGVGKQQAIEQATYKFKDPFTNDEWLEKKKIIPNKTPTGFRCTQPIGEKAKKSLRALRELKVSEQHTCIDFLGCFQCEHHALIAEKDDIWLMLSFKDSILEVLSRTSSNSVPSTDFNKILNTVTSILESYQAKAPEQYSLAYELNSESPHPLYDDEHSIDDLLRVYK